MTVFELQLCEGGLKPGRERLTDPGLVSSVRYFARGIADGFFDYWNQGRLLHFRLYHFVRLVCVN